MDVQIGELEIQSGSGGGVFNTETDSGIFFDAYVLTGDATFTGTGFCWGHLTGSDAAIHGALKSNYLTLSGSLTIASNTVVSLAGRYGAGNITFDTTFLTNYGTVVWSNANLYGQSGPQIDNRGLWDAQTDNTFSGSVSGGTTFFNNFGTFRKSGTSGANSKLDTHVTFYNSGTVDVQIGELEIQSGSGGGVFNTETDSGIFFDAYVLTGDATFTGTGFCWGHLTGSDAAIHGALKSNYLTLSGSLTIASNTVVNLGGNYGTSPINFDTLILTNHGTVICSNANLNGQSSPQINNCGLWDDATDNTFAGGGSGGITTFNNFGIFRKSGTSGANSKLDNNVTFNNAGTVDVQIGGLTIGGSYTLAGGMLNFGINSSNNFGSIYLAGDAALTGTVSANLNNNYAPVAGASFPVLAYGSESGIFTTLKLPAGFAWQTNYGATTFTLSISAVLPAQLSVARCGNNTISFAWNGVRGQSYQVQYTTNLVSLDWINLGDLLPVTNGTMTASDTIHSDPQRFYRVVLIQ